MRLREGCRSARTAGADEPDYLDVDVEESSEARGKPLRSASPPTRPMPLTERGHADLEADLVE